MAHNVHFHFVEDYDSVWPDGAVVRAWTCHILYVRISAVPLSGNNLGQVVHTHVPLSSSSIIWYQSRR